MTMQKIGGVIHARRLIAAMLAHPNDSAKPVGSEEIHL
jgi:hypothetical protein